ncbi:hypothetical protein EW026_g3063 [Hermanssonia centrifuga]|uniref:rRNA-processing protein EFG1 n=1 Tax=Hermanssonia centrifuga TaxID=98765 RepID=A0A4S4KN85_9APHY|nr:hypothetical protein EW026_g3063 [Hermanssonia centrifuga]
MGKPYARKDATNQTPNVVPGVQKIKAALRQTRRLLAKEKLGADVRVATERKQKALEADLVEAERVRKERTLAQRYHKVKFFERQKVTRKLSKIKRQLEESTEKKERKKLEKVLLELRVDLNYIMHYPKLKKYISLFPPEVRRQQPEEEDDGSSEKESRKQTVEETDAQREEIRKMVRGRMESGELSLEPELEDQSARAAKRATDDSIGRSSEAAAGTKGKKGTVVAEKDEFFGEDSGEDEDGDEDMGDS